MRRKVDTQRVNRRWDVTRPWPDEDGPWTLRLRFRLGGKHGLRCTGLELTLSEPPKRQQSRRVAEAKKAIARPGVRVVEGGPRPVKPEIDWTLLRELKISEFARTFGRSRASDLRNAGLEPFARMVDRETPGSRRKPSAPPYLEVAKVYKAAFKRGDNPTSTVAAHFGISKALAAMWVRRTRKYYPAELPAAFGKGIGGTPL